MLNEMHPSHQSAPDSKVSRYKAKSAKDNSWIFGDYFAHQTRMPSPIGDELKSEEIKHYIVYHSFADWNMPIELIQQEVHKPTVCRYTGIQNYYEGDVLLDKFNNFHLVIFNDGGFCLSYSNKQDSNFLVLTESNCQKFSLVYYGNIYDNSELITEKFISSAPLSE